MVAMDIPVHPIQADFLQASEPMTAMVAGIGSGKTIAGCLKGLMATLGQPAMRAPNLGMIVAPTYPMLRDSTLRVWQERCGPWQRYFGRADMVAKMKNGSEVLFRSADDPDRLRGPSLSWVYIDEAALCDEDVWDICLGRLRQFGVMGRMWLTTTPKGRNWVWDVFEKERREGYRIIKARTADNPYLSPEYLARLRDAYGAGLWARQELEGEFVMIEGGMFSPQWLPIEEQAPPYVERMVRFWDLAGTAAEAGKDPDWTCGVKEGIQDGIFHLLDCERFQATSGTVELRVMATARRDGFQCEVVLEQEGGSSGKAVAERYVQLLSAAGYIARARPSTTSKQIRAMPFLGQCENGRVRMVKGEWNAAFLEEAVVFPFGRHDDQVDAAAGAFAELATGLPETTGLVYGPRDSEMMISPV